MATPNLGPKGPNLPRDVSVFFSRPDLHAPRFNIHFEQAHQISSGYYFVSPRPWLEIQNGPYIFDGRGELVWSGASVSTGSSTHGVHVCDYEGVPHLCFWEGEQIGAVGRGRDVILDSSYRVVAAISGGTTASDFHEFHTIENGKVALISVYKPSPYDLSQINGNMSTQLGWIYNCGFQEIDIATGRTIFEWFVLDHINPSETFTPLGGRGDGQTFYEPWDYMHINSVEKTRDGSYIVSGRHTNTIYKISGIDGSIIWRLGGSMSDFAVDFPMGFQHDVRILEETEKTTKLSLFNNAWDGKGLPISERSSGMLVSVDHVEHEAVLVQEYFPLTNILPESQGNLQRIPSSKNMLICWGSLPWITEYLANGTMVLNASLTTGASPMYKASKSPWVGKPIDSPTVWSYAKNTKSQTVSYVSWNGATEVSAWRIHGVENAEQSVSNPLGHRNRSGFETMLIEPSYWGFIFAEALASDGSSLANSSITPTFIPGPDLAEHCSELGCPNEVIKRDFLHFQNGIRPPRISSSQGLGSPSVSTSRLIEWAFAIIGFVTVFRKLLKLGQGAFHCRGRFSENRQYR